MSFFNNPKNRKRKRAHGFLSRIKSRTGKAVVKRRIRKRRNSITV